MMRSSGILIAIILHITLDYASCFTVRGNHTEKRVSIVGGNAASIQEAPFVVQLMMEKGFCGGSVITRKHILTAQHCVQPNLESKSPIYVLIGSDRLNSYAEKIKAVDYFMITPAVPNEYDGIDLAILTLETLIQNPLITPIPLVSRRPNIGDYVASYGFGISTDDGTASLSRYLKKVVGVVTNCNQKYRSMCVQTAYGQGICKGDSGSSLVNAAGELVGIVSGLMVDGCGFQNPELYTSVFEHRDIINKYIYSKNTYTPGYYKNNVAEQFLQNLFSFRY